MAILQKDDLAESIHESIDETIDESIDESYESIDKYKGISVNCSCILSTLFFVIRHSHKFLCNKGIDESMRGVFTLGRGQHPYSPVISVQQVSSPGHEDSPSGHMVFSTGLSGSMGRAARRAYIGVKNLPILQGWVAVSHVVPAEKQ